LTFLPIIVFFTMSLYTYIIFIWHQHSLQKDILQFSWAPRSKTLKTSFILLNFLKCILFYTFLFFIFFFYIMKVQNLNYKLFYFNNFIINQLFVFILIFMILIYTFIISPYFFLNKSIDTGLFIILLILSSINLLTSNNILTIFINLEIFNILIIYSFLISSYVSINVKKNINFKINWLLKSTSYQFILNFFTSIIFFFLFNMLLIYSNSTNFIFLSFFSNLNINLFNTYLSLFYFSIFIKFGIGPWIFFKIEIYQGFNLFLLMIYTIIYFLIILIFFLNLFIIFNANISYILLMFFINIFLLTSLIFLLFIFSYFNIFMFFSFSSLINIIIILFQLIIFLIFFK